MSGPVSLARGRRNDLRENTHSHHSQFRVPGLQEDNIECHPSDSLVHDNSVHYPSPVSGFRRISSQSSSRAFRSDRPPRRARVTYAETVAGDMTALTPDYPWISGPGYRAAARGSSTTGGPSPCPDS